MKKSNRSRQLCRSLQPYCMYSCTQVAWQYSCTAVQRYHAPCKGFFVAARPPRRLLLLFRNLHAPIHDPEISYSGFSFSNHAYCAHLQALVRITYIKPRSWILFLTDPAKLWVIFEHKHVKRAALMSRWVTWLWNTGTLDQRFCVAYDGSAFFNTNNHRCV